ncbi:MAG: hypothetical protein U0401_32760 [Anaerolineae bacterium]
MPGLSYATLFRYPRDARAYSGGRLSLGHPGAGEGFELLAITACILGGLSLMGGQGSVIGILVGSALIGVLQNEMNMLNINPSGTKSSLAWFYSPLSPLTIHAAAAVERLLNEVTRRPGML